jgi:5-methylcytosine-specific restriction endonuclease McrA
MTKKEIRKKFRQDVFRRDKYHCKCCGIPGFDRQGSEDHLKYHKDQNAVELDAHHIQERNDTNYVKENGISVCGDCHLLCEKFHQTNGKEWVEGFHPNDLYLKIGSDWLI